MVRRFALPARMVLMLSLVAAVLAAAGCGSKSKSSSASSSSAAATAPKMTRAQAGQAYLAYIAPVNAAGNAFAAKAGTWSNSTTGAQAEADARPLEQQLAALRPKLLSLAQSYPPAASQLRALVDAYSPLQGDLQGLKTVTPGNAQVWLAKLTRDSANTRAASARVRSALGLPPAPR